jgi:microcompartment protein CcmK/EutM
MLLAKVIGNVVATQKSPELEGAKLLFIHPYVNKDRALVPAGNSIVAVDSVGAGLGELVLYTQGSAARLTPATKGAPADAVIVGIVDSVEVEGATVEKP